MCGLCLKHGVALLLDTGLQKQSDLVLVLVLSSTNSQELNEQLSPQGFIQCPPHGTHLSGSLWLLLIVMPITRQSGALIAEMEPTLCCSAWTGFPAQPLDPPQDHSTGLSTTPTSDIFISIISISNYVHVFVQMVTAHNSLKCVHDYITHAGKTA